MMLPEAVTKNADFFREALMAWFTMHGRHDLPWQHPRTPYRVWLSEIMLQQTQVQTVIPYFLRFLGRFPDLKCLADAHLDEVLQHWAGLGYYARGRNLHKTANILYRDRQGEWPTSLEGLQALPGIGYSTAAAILAQAFGLPYPILDANVKRVLARYFGIADALEEKSTQNTLLKLAHDCLDKNNPCDYTQAIMDLGATCCSAKKPQCLRCPVRANCRAYQDDAIGRYPKPKAKKTKLTYSRFFYLLYDAKQCSILLQRRAESGIWGGLWCLPEATVSLQTDKAQTGSYRKLDSLKHSFSHYHLILEPELLLVDKDNYTQHLANTEWFTLSMLDKLGLPKPIQTLLQRELLQIAR